jgi:arylsulfatase A-like enzyme
VQGHGISFNGWTAKPWHLAEYLHPTNWISERTREFMAGYDEDDPLFLTASYYAPHPPLIPPAFYLERYLRMDLPPAAIGDWAEEPPNGGLGLPVDSHVTCLRGEALRSAQAGYFGLINQIDDQLYWLIRDFRALSGRAGRPWVIIFTTDHGEMLGDHDFFRKCEPYEGSARIPLLIQGSPELGLKAGQRSMAPVGLEDLMPTMLELAGLEAPAGVDGASLVPILRGEAERVREWIHGEHSPCYSRRQAYHMLTDGRMKYVWRPTGGQEQLFDLERDPQELRDLARERSEDTGRWRSRLIERLRDRPEGFTDGERLVAGRTYEAILPKAK